MVENINWGNYSSSQIVELKKSGVKVPEDIYNKAIKEVTKDSSDDKKVAYQIVDMSSAKNEAQEFTDKLKASGMNLREVITELVSKSQKGREEINEMNKKLEDKFSYVQILGDKSKKLVAQATDISSEITDKTKKTKEEIKFKQSEVIKLNEKSKTEELTEDEKQKLKYLRGEINSISDFSNILIKFKQDEVKGLSSEAVSISSETKSLMNAIGKGLTKAGDGKEISQEIIDKSNEAKGLKKRREFDKAGFSSNFFKRFNQHQKLIKGAIAEGNFMNIASDDLKGTAEKIASQNEFTITKGQDAVRATGNLSNIIDENELKKTDTNTNQFIEVKDEKKKTNKVE